VDPAEPLSMKKKLRRIDVAFLALHGHGGEDGKIQLQLDRMRIPYIGSDFRGSRNAFDKAVAKKKFIRGGIPTPPYVIVTKSDWKSKLAKFPAPYFVKPLRDGSSMGVFFIEDLAKSAEKLKQALNRYGKLLVEKKIVGREFTVGILGQKALPVIELIPNRPFYDYKAKYTRGMTDYLVPAPISERLSHKLQKLGLEVHRCLGLRDFSRVDIMVDEKGIPYVLEANSIPGLTELSLLPKAAQAAGISFEEMCYRLIAWAYERWYSPPDKAINFSHGKKEAKEIQ
jgi:D-alanine-D-alanine ligase